MAFWAFSEEAEEALIRRIALVAGVPRAQLMFASEPKRALSPPLILRGHSPDCVSPDLASPRIASST